MGHKNSWGRRNYLGAMTQARHCVTLTWSLKCAENCNKRHDKMTFLNAIGILAISNRDSFRALFDKKLLPWPVFYLKNMLVGPYFSIGNRQH